jgi:lipopolysaccharide export system protein LptC
MKERFPTVASIVILVTLVIGTWFAAEYTKQAVDLDASSKHTDEPDSWGRVMTMVRSDESGFAVTRIEGTYMEHFPIDDSYEIIQPRAMSLRPEQPPLMGVAQFARVLDDGNRIVMKQDAVVLRLPTESTDPLNITSEEITMLVQQDVAYTDLPALAVRSRSTLRGIGMRFDNRTGELKVYDSTDVEIAPRARPASPPDSESSPE